MSGILHKFSSVNSEYIVRNSSLLPIVLANNNFSKIKMYGDNSYMFLCQFHREQTPSMGVSDIKNLLFCFGCGCGFNVVSYLKCYEGLDYNEVIELLAQIYLCDIHLKNPKLTHLVEKYRNSILSDSYMELLKKGYDRLKGRQLEFFNGINVDDYYSNKFQTIERIKNCEYDPNFEYIEPQKRMHLSKK